MNSELRQDIVSGDWIVIAPKRAKKPEQFIKKEKRIKTPLKNCPFENPQKSGNKEPLFIVYNQKDKKDWKIQVVENKYPVFAHKAVCPTVKKKGRYSVIDGVGQHDLLITRDHYRNFPRLDSAEAFSVFNVFQEHYRRLADDKCAAYISMFHNWGPKAGASIYHPHYQIVSIPVVPPDVSHSLEGSARFYQKNKKCVHCVIIEQEKKNKSRVVFENKGAIVFAPFVSKEPFELRVFPKKHLPYFEDAKEEDLKFVVEALRKSLAMMEKKLKDPDYNFFIHTSPVSEKRKHNHYHWHIEIQPKISISAGFELGTGIEITVVDPDEAAKILKN